MLHSKLRRTRWMAALTTVVVFAGCSSSTEPEPLPNLVETAQAAGQFNTLLAAAQAAGLAGTLSNDGPFTVFAPTDAAFNALPTGTVQALLQDVDALRAILLFHVVQGEVTAAQAANLNQAPTLNGQAVPITRNGSGLRVGGANVIQADIRASNGIIHVIDAVLIP
jgi:uncharacterized surface protein with fasciclin (FAS1) repeats